jgi:excinuclease ABC subunit B
VYLFADTITQSMETLLRVTDYRRNRQMEYNKAHGITPKSVVRAVQESLQAILKGGNGDVDGSMARETAGPNFSLTDTLAELQEEMLRASANLEYEKAALLRDQIQELKAGAGIAKIEPRQQPVSYRTPKKGRGQTGSRNGGRK